MVNAIAEMQLHFWFSRNLQRITKPKWQGKNSTFVSFSVEPFVERPEALKAELSGTRYGIEISSWTTDMYLMFTRYGVKRDDLVITPSFTFIGMANSVAYCGAMSWFIDIKTIHRRWDFAVGVEAGGMMEWQRGFAHFAMRIDACDD